MLVSGVQQRCLVTLTYVWMFSSFFSLTGYYRILSIALHALRWFSRSLVSDSLQPCGPQHARLPCPSPAPGACSDSCPLSWWCHPTILSSVVPFSCPQSFLTLGSFPVSQLFASGGQSIGASASALPVNSQGWFPLGWTGWISLQCCTAGPPYPVNSELEYNRFTVLCWFFAVWHCESAYVYTHPLPLSLPSMPWASTQA